MRHFLRFIMVFLGVHFMLWALLPDPRLAPELRQVFIWVPIASGVYFTIIWGLLDG